MFKRDTLLIALFCFLLGACDSSTRSRSKSRLSGNSSSSLGPQFTDFGDSGTRSTSDAPADPTNDTPGPTPAPTEDSSPQASNDATNVPEDAKGCNWSTDGQSGFNFTHSHTGDYTFCQSTANETIVYIQTKVPFTSRPICIIPTTHSTSNGSTDSTYVGEPRCLFTKSSTLVYRVELYKNRVGFGNYPITGAMLMKDELEWYNAPYYQYMLNPDAYLFCSQWKLKTNDSSYCHAFDQAGHYVYHQF